MRAVLSVLFLSFIGFNLIESSQVSLINTQCEFNSTKNYLFCNTSAGADGCEANATGIALSFTLYGIGETKATGGENPMVWFRIYPRKEDNSGWWYYKGNKNTHSKLLIHPKEKNSKSNEGFVINDNICWAKLHEMIRSSKSIETIKAQKFAKSLFGSPFEKVKTIGTLKVVQ